MAANQEPTLTKRTRRNMEKTNQGTTTKERFIREKIRNMSPEQKVGALMTLGFNGTYLTPNILDSVQKYHCGGLRLTPSERTFGTYVDPRTGKSIVNLKGNEYHYKGKHAPELTGGEYKTILDKLKTIATARPGSLPLHFSFDNEGDGNEANCSFTGFSMFPKPMGLQATGELSYAYEAAKCIGRQARSVGMNIIHSPVLDVNSDPRNPEINIRAYSDQGEIVARWASESCRGFRDAGVIATAKHFPGRGHSPDDAHYGVPVIDVDFDTLWARELLPYRVLIEQNLLPSIMLAHGIYPSLDPEHLSTVSKKIITGLLRDKMTFSGVITTDSMTMGSVATRYGVPEACAMSLAAGADLVLMKAQNEMVDQTFQAIFSYVEKGQISEAELDAKLERIFSMKYDYGLFSNEIRESPESVTNDPHIKQIAREIADKSVKILKDTEHLLPLKAEDKLLFIEQITTTRNSMGQHPAMMFEQIIKRNSQVAFLEIGFSADEQDKQRIHELVARFDKIVITSFYNRAEPSNTAFFREIIALHPGKKFIIVTNTPYELSIPGNAETVICTYSTTSDSLHSAVKVLFGEIKQEGVRLFEQNLW